MMKFLPKQLVLLAIAFFSGQALTGEYEKVEPIGPPEFFQHPAVRLSRLKIEVKDQSVALVYQFINEGDVKSSVAFNLYSPFFGWVGADSAYPDRSAQGLSVQLNGQPASVKRSVIAVHDGRAINSELKRHDVDPMRPARGADAPWADTGSNRKRLRSLLNEGILVPDDGRLIPAWRLLIGDHWRLPLAGRERAEMRVTYKLQPSYEPVAMNSTELDAALRAHCSNAEGLSKEMGKMGVRQSGGFVMQQVVLAPATVMDSGQVTLDVQFNSSWSGLNAAVSVVCQGSGGPVYGWPNIRDLGISPSRSPLSILILLPQ